MSKIPQGVHSQLPLDKILESIPSISAFFQWFLCVDVNFWARPPKVESQKWLQDKQTCWGHPQVIASLGCQQVRLWVREDDPTAVPTAAPLTSVAEPCNSGWLKFKHLRKWFAEPVPARSMSCRTEHINSRSRRSSGDTDEPENWTIWEYLIQWGGQIPKFRNPHALCKKKRKGVQGSRASTEPGAVVTMTVHGWRIFLHTGESQDTICHAGLQEQIMYSPASCF